MMQRYVIFQQKNTFYHFFNKKNHFFVDIKMMLILVNSKKQAPNSNSLRLEFGACEFI